MIGMISSLTALIFESWQNNLFFIELFGVGVFCCVLALFRRLAFIKR